MSTTIDNRVIEMQFDNRNFEQNVAQSMSTLDKLKASLNMDGAAKSFDELDKAAKGVNLGSLSSGVEAVAKSFSALEVIAISALASITNQAVMAGEKVVKALTIQGAIDGFKEYELSMDSIKVIMASTGESLDTVKKHLQDLNEYADKTIYSFSDMTQNIGKFTNAGVKLEDAKTAIIGISNAAAISGAGTVEASRAMYNIAQSLGMGFMQRIDWKSIENANMATVEFKKNLIDTAVAMGTVVKEGDLYSSTTTNAKGDIADALSMQAMFTDGLQYQWLTTDVLMKTLIDYGDETTAIGKKGWEAAQEVTTFTKMMAALTEAVGTGWADSMTYILGDYEEAKKMWTGVNNILSEIIDNSSKSRNELLKGWKEMGGRDAMINAISVAFNNLRKVVETVRNAFYEIFEKIDSKKLYELTKSIENFIIKLTPSEERLEAFGKAVKGVFYVVKIAINIVKQLGPVLKPIGELLSHISDSLLEFAGKVSDSLEEIAYGTESLDIFGKAAEKVQNVVDSIINSGVFETLSNIIADARDKFLEFFSFIASKVSGKSIEFDGSVFIDFFKDLYDVSSKAFDKIHEGMGPIADFFKKIYEIGSVALSRIGDILSSIFNKFNDIEPTDFLKNLLSIANVILTGAILDKLVGFKKVIGDLGDIFDTIADAFEMFQAKVKAGIFRSYAVSIAILAGALMLLSSVDTDKLLIITPVVVGLIGAMGGVMVLIEKLSRTAPKAANSVFDLINSALESAKRASTISAIGNVLVKMAASLVILAVAVKLISDVEPKKLAMSLVTLMSSLTIMAASLVGLSKIEDLDSSDALKGLVKMALSLVVVAVALRMVSKIEPEKLLVSLATMSIVLMLMTAMAMTLDKNKANADSLVLMALSLVLVADAFKILAKIPWEKLMVSTLAMIAMLGTMTLMSSQLNGIKGTSGATSLLLMSAALIGMAMALKLISNINLEDLAKSFLALAGLLGLCVLVAPLLGPAAAGILLVGGGLALIGVSVLAVGLGLQAIALGLTAIAIAATAGAATIVTALSIIAVGLATAFTQFLTTLVQKRTELFNATVGLITIILDAIGTLVPKIIETGTAVLMAFLRGIEENIGEIVESGISIAVNIIEAIAHKLPDVIQAGWDLLIAFIDGITNSINENMPRLVHSMEELFWACINAIVTIITGGGITDIRAAGAKLIGDNDNGFIGGMWSVIKNIGSWIYNNLIGGILKGIGNGLSAIWDKAKEVGNSILGGMRKSLDIHSPSKEAIKLMGFFDQGVVNGLRKGESGIFNTASDLGDGILTTLSTAISNASDMVGDELNGQPTITPILDLSNVRSGANSINSMFARNQAMSVSAGFSGSYAQRQTNAMDELYSSINGIGPGSTTNNAQTNYFNITGNDPKAIADEVSQILQRQVERRDAQWA